MHRQRTQVWAALGTVYVVWGSTYLAIRVAVHPTHGAPLPPLLLVGVRYAFAGLVMLAVTVRRPAADGRPDPLGWRQWGAAAAVGGALVLGGNGLVTVAEQRVASWVAAVVVATVPIWAALIGTAWLRDPVERRQWVGLLLGLGGVAVLVVGSGDGRVDAVGVLTVLAAALSWAGGSVWSRTAPLARRPFVSTGMEMLVGGLAAAALGLATGEAADVHLGAVSGSAWAAFGYLVVAGSMLAYTAYVWVLRNAPLSLVTTYAYVNPLVAVLLGTLLLDEPFTARTALAALTIVAGVVLIVSRRATEPPPSADREPRATAEARR